MCFATKSIIGPSPCAEIPMKALAIEPANYKATQFLTILVYITLI
jgi:hypothetical protein